MNFKLFLMIVSLGGWAQVSADVYSPHPLDIEFDEKLEFLGTNLQMIQNVTAADRAWRAEINRQMEQLLPLLSESQQVLLKDAQEKWEVAEAANRAFLQGDREQLRSIIGREGEIGVSLKLMQKVRARALELQSWLQLYSR